MVRTPRDGGTRRAGGHGDWTGRGTVSDTTLRRKPDGRGGCGAARAWLRRLVDHDKVAVPGMRRRGACRRPSAVGGTWSGHPVGAPVKNRHRAGGPAEAGQLVPDWWRRCGFLPQWQINVSSGGRIWCCVETATQTVWLAQQPSALRARRGAGGGCSGVRVPSVVLQTASGVDLEQYAGVALIAAVTTA